MRNSAGIFGEPRAKKDETMKGEFTAVLQRRGKWHIGFVEEIPGVNTQGRTLKEARENLREALALILESNRAIAKKATRGGALRREPIAIELAR